MDMEPRWLQQLLQTPVKCFPVNNTSPKIAKLLFIYRCIRIVTCTKALNYVELQLVRALVFRAAVNAHKIVILV